MPADVKSNMPKMKGLTEFFKNYSENFGSLLKANLIFDVPMLIGAAIIFLISYLIGGVSMFVLALFIPLLAPFSAGIVLITRRITEHKDFKVWQTFKDGVKDNFLQFTVQGVINYLVFVGFYATFEMYSWYISNPMVMAALVLSIIIALMFFCMAINIGVMTVTVKLKQVDIYKNALILVFMALVNNLKTVISLMFMGAVSFFIIFTLPDMVILSIIFGVLMITVLPTFVFLLITHNSYPAIQKYIIQAKTDSDLLNKKDEENNRVEVSALTREELLEYAEGNPDEFVFVGGKMLRRSTVQKMLKEYDGNVGEP